MISNIDFSAQFGGQDAATAVLPHFKALKTAARGIQLQGFPFPQLAFILRVDGEVSCYGFSGAAHVDIDKKGKYLSVDIGIGLPDRDRILDAVSSAILTSSTEIRRAQETKGWRVEFEALDRCLSNLVTRYKNEIVNLNGDAWR